MALSGLGVDLSPLGVWLAVLWVCISVVWEVLWVLWQCILCSALGVDLSACALQVIDHHEYYFNPV